MSTKQAQRRPRRSPAQCRWKGVCVHTGPCGDNDDDGSGQNHTQEKQHFSLSLPASRHFLNTAENNKVSE